MIFTAENLKKVVFGLAIIFLMPFVVMQVSEAYQINTWNTGNGKENLTFSGGENQTLSIALPMDANVTGSNLNLNGYTNNGTVTGYYNLCYQESANTLNQTGIDGICSQNYNGSYYAGNYFFINYTKPNISFSNALWQVKHGLIIENISIPPLCFNQNPIQLRIYSALDSWSVGSSSYCNNGSDFINIGLILSQSQSTYCYGYCANGYEGYLWDGDWNTWAKANPTFFTWTCAYNGGGCVNASIYEEAIIFGNQTISYPTNFSLFSNTSLDYQNLSTFNGSTSTSLNNSFLNDWIRNNCNSLSCTYNLNLFSATLGILEADISSTINWTDIIAPRYSNNQTNATALTKYNDTIQHSVYWEDYNLSQCFFSWNNTGTWINYSNTAFNNSTQTYNFTISEKVNNSLNAFTIGWQQQCNDTLGNINITPIFTYSIANTLPTVSVGISPSPANATQNLSAIIVNSSDVVSIEIMWYINTIENSSLRNLTKLTIGNYTSGDRIIVSARAYDNFNYSAWTNSSELTLDDITPPSVSDFTGPSSETYGNSVTFSLSVIDTLSSIQSIKLEIENPSGIKTNYSMSMDSGTNAANQTSSWSFIFTPSSIGTWFASCYATDTSSNIYYCSDRILTMQVTGASHLGGGSTGPSSTPISYIEPTNISSIIDFTTDKLYFTIIVLPSEEISRNKELRIYNRGNQDFEGKVQSNNPLISAQVCELNGLACQSNNIIIKQGQSKLLIVTAKINPDLESGYVGVITLLGDRDFELNVVIERPPGYSIYGPLSKSWGISEITVVILLYLVFTIIIVLTLYYLPAWLA